MMMNLGGPETVKDVHPFLLRLFSDRDIFEMPFQEIAGKLLAKRRTPSVSKQYEEIGGSPIRKWTDIQGKAMTELLDEISPETAPHKHFISFRYSEPLTEDAIESIKELGIKRVVAFSQYPQYSCTTTGSSLNQLKRVLFTKNLQDEFDISIIERWGTDPYFIEAVSHNIKETLKEWPESKRKDVVLLFSAHSIPHKVVDKGDPYPMEVASTTTRVMEYLNYSNPYRLVWQSKVGPLPWLGPQLEHALKGFAKLGMKDIMVIPIAFTSDHIETLYEIDITYKKLAEELGINMRRCKSLNDEPLFIKALANIVKNHLSSNTKTSNQFRVRCNGCTNPSCLETREYFCNSN